MERGGPASQAAAAQAPADESTAPDERLAPLRERIDALDGQLLALLSERARLAQQVGEIKRDAGAPVYRPERERWGNYVPTVLGERYDAFLYLEDTTPLQPLHLERPDEHVPPLAHVV